jgi:hypothetical protein
LFALPLGILAFVPLFLMVPEASGVPAVGLT